MNDPIRVPSSERHEFGSGLMGGPDVELNAYGDHYGRLHLRLAISGRRVEVFVDAEYLERAVRAARILAERDEK
jgi:hypothetical protein